MNRSLHRQKRPRLSLAIVLTLLPLLWLLAGRALGVEAGSIYLPLALRGARPELVPPAVPSATRTATAAAPTQTAAATDPAAPTPAASPTVSALRPTASPEACRPSQFQGPVDRTHLPLGNEHILRRDRGDRQPAVGKLWLCGVPPDGRGNADASDWSNPDGSWDYQRKPQVEGDLNFQSYFKMVLNDAGRRLITGNALPNFPTGIFPIDPNSLPYRYDRNPNPITAHEVDFDLPAQPQPAASPRCVTFGATGISLSGNAIYHASSTLGNDAAAHEMLDAYGGQSDGTTTYHTHYLSDAMLDALDHCEPGHSALMGYILDGYGIYGPRGVDGRVLSSEDLDACHGHSHPVLWDGQTVDIYHYHWTYDFPYNVGCFKGQPIKPWN